MVGTSAGSVLAAALRCGLDVRELVRHQRGIGNRLLGAPDLGCGAFPPWPSWWLGSPRLLVRALCAPGTVHPWVTAAACLPRGRADHMALRDLVGKLLAGSRRSAAPERRKTWITAVDYDSGHRVAFGRASAPPASMTDAVVASCSLPGWFQPAVIDGRRYIDGGVRSGSNADLMDDRHREEVFETSLVTSAAAMRQDPSHQLGAA